MGLEGTCRISQKRMGRWVTGSSVTEIIAVLDQTKHNESCVN